MEFVVCENLRGPAVLGLDFLGQSGMGIACTPAGTFALQGGEILVESVEVCFENTGPMVAACGHCTVPAGSVVIVTAGADVRLRDQGRVFEVGAAPSFMDEHPSVVALPVLHGTDRETGESVPYLLINLSMEDGEMERGEGLAEMGVCPYRLGEVETEQTDGEGINNIEEDGVFERCGMFGGGTEVDGKFMTSPAQMESQRGVKLQDAPVTGGDGSDFEELCDKYADIFSGSSEDVGRAPLLGVDVGAGDGPPVCRGPCGLPLEHVEWVTGELEIFERAGVVSGGVSPWAGLVVVVPKRSEPGELPGEGECVWITGY